MACEKALSIEKRSATLHGEGYSVRKIQYNDLIICRFKKTGSLEHENRPELSRTTTKAEDKRIKIISKRNRKLTKIQSILQEKSSVSTIKRRLKEADLYDCVAIRKPLLRRGNIQKRLQWGKSHENCMLDQW